MFLSRETASVAPHGYSLLCVLALAVGACGPVGTRAAARALPERTLTLLLVGPTRAQLDGSPDYVASGAGGFRELGGYARLRTALSAELRQGQGPTFTLSVGDTFYGGAAAAWSGGEVVVEPFAALGIDVCAAGPHDQAVGAQQLNRLLQRLPCALTADRSPLPTATIERRGVRVTFVVLDARATVEPAFATRGAVLDAASSARARAALEAARASDRAQVRVALTDLAPAQARRLAHEVPGFDVVVAGAGAAEIQSEQGALVVSAGEGALRLGRLALTLSEGGGVVRHELKSLPLRADRYAEDPNLRALVEASLAPYRGRARRKVAQSDTFLPARDEQGRAAFDFVAEALREVARADIALVPLSDASALGRGNILEAELWNSVPFDVPLTRERIEGRALRAALGAWLASGVADDLALSGLSGLGNAGTIEVNGEPLRDEASYWVTAPGLGLAHGDSASVSVTVHEALDRYLEANPFLRATRTGHVLAASLPSSVQCRDQLRR